MSDGSVTSTISVEYGYRLPDGTESWAGSATNATAKLGGSSFYLHPDKQGLRVHERENRKALIERYAAKVRALGLDDATQPPLVVVSRDIITITLEAVAV